MFKKLLSIVLSISFMASSLAITSFASENEEPNPSSSIVVETTPNPIQENKASPTNEAKSKVLGIEGLSDTQLQELSSQIEKKLQKDLSQEKINEVLSDQTFWQKCKKSLRNILSVATLGSLPDSTNTIFSFACAILLLLSEKDFTKAVKSSAHFLYSFNLYASIGNELIELLGMSENPLRNITSTFIVGGFIEYIISPYAKKAWSLISDISKLLTTLNVSSVSKVRE